MGGLGCGTCWQHHGPGCRAAINSCSRDKQSTWYVLTTDNNESSQQHWGQLKVVGGVPADTRLRSTMHALECSDGWLASASNPYLPIACGVLCRTSESASISAGAPVACNSLGPRCASLTGHVWDMFGTLGSMLSWCLGSGTTGPWEHVKAWHAQVGQRGCMQQLCRGWCHRPGHHWELMQHGGYNQQERLVCRCSCQRRHAAQRGQEKATSSSCRWCSYACCKQIMAVFSNHGFSSGGASSAVPLCGIPCSVQAGKV